jgi:crotonobetainyl-CoA:carnitine CoA-transferase CaiB-like acyl-CoA transferase
MPDRISPWGIYDVFAVKDNAQIFLAVVGDTQWGIFCKAFGYDDLANDARTTTNNDRVRARAWLIPLLRERLAKHSSAELAAVFEAHGLPFAPITDPQHLFDDPHLQQTGGLAPMELPDGRQTTVPLLPLKLGGERLGLRLNPPKLDEHGLEILRSLGYLDDEIVAMRSEGILRSAVFEAPVT